MTVTGTYEISPAIIQYVLHDDMEVAVRIYEYALL